MQFGRGCHLAPEGQDCSFLTLMGDGLVHSQLAFLWYSLSPLFCEWAQQCLRLELCAGKFSLFAFSFSASGYPMVWVAISSWLPQIALRAFRPSPYLKQCRLLLSDHSSSPAGLLVADASVWVTFLLGVAFRHVICGFYLFIFPRS